MTSRQHEVKKTTFIFIDICGRIGQRTCCCINGQNINITHVFNLQRFKDAVVFGGLNSNREKLELIYLHDCVTDRSLGSDRYLNVTFYNHPTDRGRNNKTLCDCLLSLFISLHKHCCVRGNIRMQGYIFLSCHDLLKLIAGVTPSQHTRRQPEPNTDNTFDETTR